MGISETYILNKPILCNDSDEGRHRPAVMVPSDATVTITDWPLDGLRMVDVLWEGRTVMMFTADLKERGKRVQTRRARRRYSPQH